MRIIVKRTFTFQIFRSALYALFSLLFILSFLHLSYAEKTMRDMISERFSERRDICLVIKSLIQEGKDTKEVVKTAIEIGYNACLVTKCAIEGDGTIQQIITGAIEAGAPSDVISMCEVDVVEKPEKIAKIHEPAKLSQKTKIALFPFENFTDDKDALVKIMPLLREELETRGLEVVDENSLNKFLLKERVRATGYISKDLSQKIGKDLNVKTILVGSINSLYPEGNLRVGLSARLINSSDSAILWANHASATGDDFTTILGLGTVKTLDRLSSLVVDRLFESFSVIPPYKEKEFTYRIAVMPFQNKSRYRDAGMIATYMFLAEIFKHRAFEPIEYGEVRRLIVELKVKYRGELDHKSIKALSELLGVDGILVGTVELYSDGLATSSSPEVAISSRLINAHKNKILQYNRYQFNGDEDTIILDWGKIRSVDNVAYKVVSQLVKKMESAKWQ